MGKAMFEIEKRLFSKLFQVCKQGSFHKNQAQTDFLFLALGKA